MKEPDIIGILQAGGVGVLPTDTLYGLVARADSPEAVARIGVLKKRSPGKPFITLIGDWADLKAFGIELTKEQRGVLVNLWPGPNSVILNGRAFRLPNSAWLRDILKATGPLVAPSANPEGEPPARDISEAQKYFGDQVDFYFDAGRKEGLPSTLIELTPAGRQKILRPGAPGDRQSQSDALPH